MKKMKLKFWLVMVLNVTCILTFLTVLRLSMFSTGTTSSDMMPERVVSVHQHFLLLSRQDGDEKLFQIASNQQKTARADIKIESELTSSKLSAEYRNTPLNEAAFTVGGIEAEYYKIPGVSPNLSRLHKLHWTSLYGKRENDSYHFFSAYYDARRGAHRPAVIVMGYVYKHVPDVEMYCVLKYTNGSRHCLESPAPKQHPTGCSAPVLQAKLFHFFCGTKEIRDDPPVTVRMSTTDACDPQTFSDEIPIRNRNADLERTPPKKFGICVGGPLIQTKTLLRDVVEFVEMSKLMGVELIVFYANDTQVDLKILQHLWTHYPDLVRIIGWKKLSKWSPMHYYGQLLIISDCFHRIMYEVDYIAMIDIDEMIIPLKHENWDEMLTSLNRGPKVSTFKFRNAFLMKSNEPPPTFCPNATVPKYFTRTKHYECFGRNYRAKTLSQARYILKPGIHFVCWMVKGHFKQYDVPGSVAHLAHYRPSIPNDCAKKPTFSDKSAMVLLDRLARQMCPDTQLEESSKISDS